MTKKKEDETKEKKTRKKSEPKDEAELLKKQKKFGTKAISFKSKDKKPVAEVMRERIDEIIQLRKEGNTVEFIANAMGTNRTTFYNVLKENEDLLEAMQRGLYEFNQNLKKSAMQRALGFVQVLTKKTQKFKVVEDERLLVEENVTTEEKWICSDLLAYKLLELDKYNNKDEVPLELKELFEKYRNKAHAQENLEMSE